MRTYLLLLLLSVSVFLGSACGARQPEPEYRATNTIKDIMTSAIDPIADVLWNATATIIAASGTEDRFPKNDEEWANVRHHAIILMEATNLLQMPGRHVTRPGEKSEAPGVELEPEEMETLINQDRQTWGAHAHGLYDATSEALKAIDAKNVQGLFDAGEKIDSACENCHLDYWYPSVKKKQ